VTWTLGAGEPTGGVPAVGLYSPAQTAPRFDYGGVRPLANVMAIVDLNRVAGFDLRQFVDYVVMAGLTRVDLDANFGDAPTILRLVSATGKDRPMGLSDWDKALLKELYATSPFSRSQRIEVSMHMAHDLAP
jgi:hypothetical protein